jgi:TfoX/Sxy family transcriptional regulator of competence genes
MFAGIVDEDRIVLKLAQDEPRAGLIALGGAPWTYAGKMTMNDWILIPDDFYDEPRKLAEWCVRAHRIAPPKGSKKKEGAKKGAAKKSASRKARR